VSHGAMIGLYKDPPPGITLNWLDDSQTFDRMLDEGQIDAATGFPGAPMRGRTSLISTVTAAHGWREIHEYENCCRTAVER
jgi:hypothetical protein